MWSSIFSRSRASRNVFCSFGAPFLGEPTAYTFFCANPSYLLLLHYRPGSVSSRAHCTLPGLQGLCSSFPRKLHGLQSFMIVTKPPRPGVITQRLCVLGPQSIFSESNRYWAWFQRKQLRSCRFAPGLLPLTHASFMPRSAFGIRCKSVCVTA